MGFRQMRKELVRVQLVEKGTRHVTVVSKPYSSSGGCSLLLSIRFFFVPPYILRFTI